MASPLSFQHILPRTLNHSTQSPSTGNLQPLSSQRRSPYSSWAKSYAAKPRLMMPTRQRISSTNRYRPYTLRPSPQYPKQPSPSVTLPLTVDDVKYVPLSPTKPPRPAKTPSYFPHRLQKSFKKRHHPYRRPTYTTRPYLARNKAAISSRYPFHQFNQQQFWNKFDAAIAPTPTQIMTETVSKKLHYMYSNAERRYLTDEMALAYALLLWVPSQLDETTTPHSFDCNFDKSYLVRYLYLNFVFFFCH